MKLKKITLNVNGVNRMIICDPEKDSLADVLRRMGLTGTKIGCGTGVCGACTVILNDKVIRSCTRKIRTVEDFSRILTIEGIGTPTHPHPLQLAWVSCGAVQCGFCSPGFIVSAYGLLLQNPDPTRDEVRDWFQKNRNACRCTGYKQIVDAVMAAAKVMRGEAPIESVTPMVDPEDKDYYGKPIARPSGLAKACGVADYGEDMALKMPDGSLHAAIIQPRVAHHAKILNIDTSEAEKMPGVVKVVTAKDVKGTNHLNLFNQSKRSTVVKPSRVILCEDKIYCYGDVVGMVVADTEEHARAAAAKVKVDVEKLPEYLNYLDAVMPDAIRIHEDTPNIYAEQPVLKGEEDIPGVIDKSAHSVRASVYTTREPHLSIEGDTVQAYMGEDGMMTIHCKAQAIYAALGSVAKAIGMDASQVRLVMNASGGSFGWSTNGSTYAMAAIASLAVDAPVKLHFNYAEFMYLSGKRCPTYFNGRLACDEKGKITALEYDGGMDHGAYSEQGDDLITRLLRFACFTYNVPNVAGLARISHTNHNYGVAYRGYGSPQVYTLTETLMDMLAEKAGIDPFEFRFQNLLRPGEGTTINSYPPREYLMEGIMNKARPIYEKAVAEAKKYDTPEVRRGVGVACGGYTVGKAGVDKCSIALELNADGTISKFDTWQDVGQGGDIGSLMVTIEALKPLGVTVDKIRLIQNDNKTCPDSGISAASRSHFMNGNATILAANKLMDAMRKPDGTYRTYEEMKAEGIETKYTVTYESTATKGLCVLDANTGVGDPSPTYSYVCTIAEVAVDTRTGKTTVLRYTCVDDMGVTANPLSLDGQAYGGISHCIGYALSENYDDVSKHNNILACGIPYIKDIPDDIQLIHMETPRYNGPFGSGGCSEGYQSCGHMAVINAIYNACGVRIYELPATPEKVKAGIDTLAAGGTIEPPKPYFLGSDLYEELDYIKANPV